MGTHTTSFDGPNAGEPYAAECFINGDDAAHKCPSPV
jgi:hypothetical protein